MICIMCGKEDKIYSDKMCKDCFRKCVELSEIAVRRGYVKDR